MKTVSAQCGYDMQSSRMIWYGKIQSYRCCVLTCHSWCSRSAYVLTTRRSLGEWRTGGRRAMPITEIKTTSETDQGQSPPGISVCSIAAAAKVDPPIDWFAESEANDSTLRAQCTCVQQLPTVYQGYDLNGEPAAAYSCL